MAFDAISPNVQMGASRWMLPSVCVAAFLVFVQTFMIAPLIPRLAEVFASPVAWVGLAVPAYLVPVAFTTLGVGPLSDRVGRNKVIVGSLLAFIVFTALTVTARQVGLFILWRVLTGVAAAGIVPISLTLIGDVVPFARRGRAVGWLFGSIAGGTAAGAAIGALLEPFIGWRSLFLGVATLCAVLLVGLKMLAALPHLARSDAIAPWSQVLRGYARLLHSARARRTYAYVLINAILQSGVFTWLGVYLHQRFGFGEARIGLVLLGYGIPGMLCGPLIGRLADRYGRSIIVPSGVVLTGLCALSLAASPPLAAVQVSVIALSLGFDLTHPQLAAIATDLGGGRGQAVALMAFSLFCGLGIGSLLFQGALSFGFGVAFALFGAAALGAAVVAFVVFRGEVPGRLHPAAAPH